MGDGKIGVNGDQLIEPRESLVRRMPAATVIAPRIAGAAFAPASWRPVPAGRDREEVFAASSSPALQSSRTIRPSVRGAISPAAAMASMTCVAMSLPEAASMSRGAPANMS